MINRTGSFLLLLILSALLFSCSTLRDTADIKEPQVQFSNMSIERISFDGVTMLFDFDVTNPNRLDVSAEGYNYEFFINDRSFIQGVQDQPITVNRESTSSIQVPVSMNFRELYETFGSVVRQDSISYQLDTEVSFKMPIMGTRKVPVQAGGVLPIPKVPRVSFGGFDVKSISFSGAEAEATFSIYNPNAFAIGLQGASYVLNVNGNQWLDTTLDQVIQVLGSEDKEITIPIKLNAAQMGSALFDIMQGNTNFNYNLTGEAKISADIEGFGDGETIPFNLDGVYRMD